MARSGRLLVAPGAMTEGTPDGLQSAIPPLPELPDREAILREIREARSRQERNSTFRRSLQGPQG